MVIIHTDGAAVVAVPVELAVDLHPCRAIALAKVVVEGGVEGYLLVVAGLHCQTAYSAVEIAGFQVMHLELAIVGAEDLRDLWSAPPQVVGVGPDRS